MWGIRRHRWLGVFLFGSWWVSGCLDGSALNLRPVEYSSDGRHVTLPLPLHISWQHCATGAVLYHPGVWEFVGRPAQAQILDWTSGYPRTLPLPGGDRPYSHSFSQSPDCRTVALEDHEKIYRFDVESGTTTPWTEGRYPAYAPDGQTLALVRDDTIILKNVADGTETPLNDLDGVLTGESSYLSGLSWGGPGTSLLVTVSYQDRDPFGEDFVRVDLADSHALTLVQSSTGVILGAPTMSPDGRYIAYVHEALSSTDGSLYIYSTEQACVVAAPPLVNADEAFWSADGTQLLVTTFPGTEGDYLDLKDVLPAGLTPPCLDL